MRRAMDAREAGTAAFKAGDNEKAVKCFTEAIEKDPNNHLLYSNRSAAYAKLDRFKDALLDANKCIDLKPDWFKGHSRRGAAYMGLKSWRAALGAFEAGLQLEPSNDYMLGEKARIVKILEGSNASSASSQSASPPASGIASRLHGLLSFMVLVFTLLFVRRRRRSSCDKLLAPW